MTEINTAHVNRLRALTDAGMMDRRNALAEARGDMSVALNNLRGFVRRMVDFRLKEGVIAKYIAPDRRLGMLVEITCEPDFLAPNDMFRDFTDDVAKRLAVQPQANLKSLLVDMVAKCHESIHITQLLPAKNQIEIARRGEERKRHT